MIFQVRDGQHRGAPARRSVRGAHRRTRLIGLPVSDAWGGGAANAPHTGLALPPSCCTGVLQARPDQRTTIEAGVGKEGGIRTRFSCCAAPPRLVLPPQLDSFWARAPHLSCPSGYDCMSCGSGAGSHALDVGGLRQDLPRAPHPRRHAGVRGGYQDPSHSAQLGAVAGAP